MTIKETPMNSDFPDFFAPATLERHIAHTMAFYHPRCIDPSGGFYHFFKDDGTVYDAVTRHLVSSTRFVFTYAMAARHGNPDYITQVRHGVEFLRNAHRNRNTGGYAWQLEWRDGSAKLLDDTNHCYGLAFVLLAYAHALMAGLGDARGYLAETFALMEERFWEPRHGLYADQASADWTKLDSYRGQNANMHACEAMLAAWQATGEPRYLHRAEELAWNITQRQAERANGMVWEHYRSDWSVDWEYNLHDKANLFRPWGYQPGHFTEWAKLLLQLEQHKAHLQRDSRWLLPAAERLFALAVERAWDYEHGGLHYGFGPDGEICDADKYFWVQAETLAAAAMLAERTEDAQYSELYQELWRYCWTHFVDHEHGAWYRILSSDNRKYSDEKSPAGKVDYHTMGACYDILRVLRGT
ncbi:AGE family epimerase/isomerase [Pseudoduganella sp.]|uniref:AGE family epimerase/isomerase n=1 Tax=Pseudoduganella sp. TaxID=1880898 RepID=UPI0035B24E2D